jgi:anti-sigma B factor antagonist
MTIDVRERGTITVVAFTGKMTIGDGDLLLRESFRGLIELGRRRFIFDLIEVPFLDTSAIGEILACRKRALDREGVVKLVLRGKAHQLFRLYELQRIFEIHGDLESALASFAA